MSLLTSSAHPGSCNASAVEASFQSSVVPERPVSGWFTLAHSPTLELCGSWAPMPQDDLPLEHCPTSELCGSLVSLSTPSYLNRKATALVISSKAPVCLICDAFHISCISFVQHSLIGLLLTLSNCMVAFLLIALVFLFRKTVEDAVILNKLACNKT